MGPRRALPGAPRPVSATRSSSSPGRSRTTRGRRRASRGTTASSPAPSLSRYLMKGLGYQLYHSLLLQCNGKKSRWYLTFLPNGAAEDEEETDNDDHDDDSDITINHFFHSSLKLIRFRTQIGLKVEMVF